MGDPLELNRFRPGLLLFVAAVAVVVVACGDREAATTTPEADVAKQIGAEKDIPLFHRVQPRWAADHAAFLRDGIPVFRVLSNDQGRINSPEDEIQHINPDMLGYAAELGISLLDWLADNPEAW